MASLHDRRAVVGVGVAAAFVGTATAIEAAHLAATPASLRTTPRTRSEQYVATEYGVRGDGRTDDAGALNALLGAVARDGGGVIVLPHGDYLVRSPVLLRSGVQLTTGAPNHGYVAASPGASAATIRAADGFSGEFVIDTDASGVVSAGLSGIDVRGTATAGGVRLRKGTWCVVAKAHIDFCGRQGVLVEAGFACVLEDLLTTNCLLQRSQPAVTGTIDLAGTDHYVSRCECNASLKAKSSPDKRLAAIVLRGANHFVADSVAEYSDVGVVVAADLSRLTNVRADTNFGDGWVVPGYGNAFAACSSIGNGQSHDGVDDGWVVSGGGNAFAGCSVRTPDGVPAVRYGFRDTVAAPEVELRTAYVGCVVDRASALRWAVDGQRGSSPVFAPHPVRPQDGQTAPDVSQTTLVVLFDYTSRTTITDFAGGVSGQTIRVLGSDAVTLRHGDRIHTASGADLPLRAGGVTQLTCYDGAWYEG